MYKATLYFGLSRKGQEPVNQAEFEAFLATYVTPTWESFTLISGVGFWKGEQEEVIILSYMGTQEGEIVRRQAWAIATEYAVTFDQEAVAIEFQTVGFELVG